MHLRARIVVLVPVLVALTAIAPAHASAKTTWLCKPSLASDPCRSSLDATVETATGAKSVERAKLPRAPKVDCFYVYPTVSPELGFNATTKVGPIYRSIARWQASRFSSVCRVFAPMYPQLTAAALPRIGPEQKAAVNKAYDGVLAAWKEYLKNDNDGRGVIFLGHSQGSGMVKRLITEQVDGNAAVRKRLISAYILGGDFKRIPACATATQTGCVIAYSSFTQTPPPSTFFGKLPSALQVVLGGATGPDLHVLCVNPAKLLGVKTLTPYFFDPAAPDKMRWITYPGLYRAACKSENGVNWLQVDPLTGAQDSRPRIKPTTGDYYGTHEQDVNIELGDLVELAGRQSTAYLARR